MNVRERYRAAYQHEPSDRVPIALSYFHPAFARRHLVKIGDGRDQVEANIQAQLKYGFDPHGSVRGTGDWALGHPNLGEETSEWTQANGEWVVSKSATTQGSTICTQYCIETPRGNTVQITATAC